MKRSSALLAMIGTFLAFNSISTYQLFDGKSEKLEAGTISGGQLYVQIENINDLRIGDTVLFGADHGDTTLLFTYLAGNPIFSVGEEVAGANHDQSKYYFSTSEAIPWVVERGIAENTYSFKSIKDASLEKNYSHPTRGRYLAYGHNYSGPNYRNIQAYGDINTSGSKNEFSSWTVSIDANKHAHVQRYGEEYSTEIQYKYYSYSARNNFGYYQDSSNLKLYRKVELNTTNFDYQITKFPDKDEYVFGESTLLTGLEFSFTSYDSQNPAVPYAPFVCSYENEPDFFASAAVSLYYQKAYFSWCGFDLYYDARVVHDTSDEHRYARSNNRFYDPRGTYVLGFEYQRHYDDGSQAVTVPATCVVDVSSLNSSAKLGTYKPLWDIYDPIIDTNYNFDGTSSKNTNVTNNVVQIVVEDNDDGDDFDDTFIKVGSDYVHNGENGYLSKSPLTESNRSVSYMNVDYNNHICFSSVGALLAYDKTLDGVHVIEPYDYSENESNYIPVELYRLEMTPNLNLTASLDQFKDRFFDLTAAFDPSGLTKNITLSDWNTIQNLYNGLNLEHKGYLGSLTYTHNQEAERSFAQLADIYDSVYDIYRNDGFTDFMGRQRAMLISERPRDVSKKGTHCSIDVSTVAGYQYSLTAEITPDAGYVNPDSVEILMGQQPLREDAYTYNRSTGTITINQYVIVDDIVINVEAERQSAHAADEIREISTVPYLSYDYEKDEENFEFSNVIIRFRGIVSKTLWDELDEDDHNILGFGILLTTEAYLNGAELKSLYEEADGVNVKKFYLEDDMPTLLEADKYDEIDVDSYSWNLRKVVSQDKLTRRYAAVTFINTRDYGVVFFKQATASVKSAAQDLLNTDSYDENYREGSLNYLANLED